MRYVFFGTPRFAEFFLEELIQKGFSPVAVVTNPDRPTGKKKILTAPPVKKLIERYNQGVSPTAQVHLFQPESPDSIIHQLSSLNADLFIVAAYSKILSGKVISLPTRATIGVHPSLLPLYRGASPIQTTLLSGDRKTGVTLYEMDEQIDHGAIVATTEVTIEEGESYLHLEEKLSRAAAHLAQIELPSYLRGEIRATPQNHTAATFTKKFATADGEVKLGTDDPLLIYRKIKALNPEPGVFTMNLKGYEGKRVKLLDANLDGKNLAITLIHIAGGKKPQPL